MKRREILETASACVCGDRDERYGSPEDSFKLIARFWSDYLRRPLERYDPQNCGDIIAPRDVAVMMVLFKAARIASGKPHADNWIDLAGYAACGGEIEGD